MGKGHLVFFIFFLLLNLLWITDPLWESIESCGSLLQKNACLCSYRIVAYNCCKGFLKPRFTFATVGREREGEGHSGLREQHDKGTETWKDPALVLLELRVYPGGGWQMNLEMWAGTALWRASSAMPWCPALILGTEGSHCMFSGEVMWQPGFDKANSEGVKRG